MRLQSQPMAFIKNPIQFLPFQFARQVLPMPAFHHGLFLLLLWLNPFFLYKKIKMGNNNCKIDDARAILFALLELFSLIYRVC